MVVIAQSKCSGTTSSLSKMSIRRVNIASVFLLRLDDSYKTG